MADTPIAVIVVCRNAHAALIDTLEHLSELGDRRVLPIVIDGASTDGTSDWLTNHRDQLFHAVSEPDHGIYDAMNKGWQAAPVDAYVVYLGAGDRLLELPTPAELGDGPRQAPVVIGDCLIGTHPFHSRWGGAEMRLRNTAHHQARMVHKSVSPEPPFDVSMRVYADWDFNLRMMRRGIRALSTPRLRAYAEPGGASWLHDLGEIRRVAARHGGWAIGWASWFLNRASLWRRMSRER